MKLAVPGLAMLAIVLAACSGAAPSEVAEAAAPTPVIIYVTPPPAATAESAPSVVPAASPTPAGPMSVAYAAKVYLAVATRYNKINDTAHDKLPDYPTLRQWRAYYKARAANMRDFSDRLRSRVWPPEAAADMKLLLRKDAEQAFVALELSVVKTFAELDHLHYTYDKLSLQSSGLANAVRTDLGLDPVPVE